MNTARHACCVSRDRTKETVMKSLFVVMGMFVAACSHQMMRGSVVMKTTDTDAHVCLGRGEVAVGDHVHLFHNDCVGQKAAQCRRVLVGDGTVMQLFDDHYSLVRFPMGTAFAEGDTVERAN
jgi:hypothetical protein